MNQIVKTDKKERQETKMEDIRRVIETAFEDRANITPKEVTEEV